MADLVECVLKEREQGYSLYYISVICGCSIRKVREILKKHGDPLKRIKVIE